MTNIQQTENSLLSQWLTKDEKITYGREKYYNYLTEYRIRNFAIRRFLSNQILLYGGYSRNQLNNFPISELMSMLGKIYHRELSLEDIIVHIFAMNKGEKVEKIISNFSFFRKQMKKELLPPKSTIDISIKSLSLDIAKLKLQAKNSSSIAEFLNRNKKAPINSIASLLKKCKITT
mgnify:CR=1 FL=1